MFNKILAKSKLHNYTIVGTLYVYFGRVTNWVVVFCTTYKESIFAELYMMIKEYLMRM